MSNLHELYQEILLEHNNKPRNFRQLEDANRQADGYNPLCGDQITLYLKVEDDVITDVAFQGHGCAISRASASMLTQSVKGETLAKAEEIFDGFHALITDPDAEVDYDCWATWKCCRESPLSPPASNARCWPGTPSTPPSKARKTRLRRSRGGDSVESVVKAH